MIRAAGVLFVTPDNLGLFLKRGPIGDHAGEWCCPGGKWEAGETIEDTAIRETLEETGFVVEPETLRLHTRSIAIAGTGPSAMPAPAVDAALPVDAAGAPAVETLISDTLEDVDFTTFLVKVPEPFVVKLCDESSGWAWASLDSPPLPLHPGVSIALDRLTMDELGVARAMAAGQLTSPQAYYNMVMFAIRITGTGVSFRSALDEFVLRDPGVYMTEEFLARCNGLPVILRHPKKTMLNSTEFRDRIVGTTFLPYLRPDLGEVWAIAKIYDADAVAAMASVETSTSPGVVFTDPTVNSKLKIVGGAEDGKHVLIEGKPGLLDHIAICELGVWDKGNGPSGVDNFGIVEVSDSEPVSASRPDIRIDREMTLLSIRMSNLLSSKRIGL